MPTYIYRCLRCEQQVLRELNGIISKEQYEELVLFETSHRMEPTAKELRDATTCPRCGGVDCEKSYYGSNIIAYIRGNGFLDKAGCIRDMNVHHLTTHDPYADLRQPGEVEDLKLRLKRAGQHQSNPKHFVSQRDMEKAVGEVIKPKPEKKRTRKR